MRAKTALAYAVCCLAWGSTWLAIKIGLQDLPPLRFAGLRMLVACAVLVPFAGRALRAPSARPTRAEWRDIALIGALQIGGSYALVFVSAQWIPSSVSAALFATFPIWTSLLAHFLLRDEPLTWGRGAAAGLGFLGVGVLQGPALGSLSFSSKVAVGSALALLTPLCSAAGNVWMKRQLPRVNPVVNLCAQLLVGAAVLLALSAAVEGGVPAHWELRSVLALLYLAVVGTAVAFFALFWMMPHIPVSAVGAIPLIDTTLAVALGAAVLREPLTWRFVAGATLVLLAAALANGVVPRLRSRAPSRDAAPATP
ncbi:MAG TPA: EamA family transporter [Myxococcales bacterium]|nr:EamA family transporter [Myxococcales bacterium]